MMAITESDYPCIVKFCLHTNILAFFLVLRSKNLQLGGFQWTAFCQGRPLALSQAYLSASAASVRSQLHTYGIHKTGLQGRFEDIANV